ncbi:MAG: alkaline phosphatase family protein, partial [Anaerolineae bacterium]|nr:alkaline phosphatase family protein [Anaerolineae bacterium]
MVDTCLPAPLPQPAADLERHLVQQRAPTFAGLGLPADLVFPCYAFSIANLPATLAALLGGELPGAAPPLPRTMWGDLADSLQRVVCIILDAVGWKHLSALFEDERELSLAQLAREGRFFPITSVFPSTTTSALVTLWTGYPPAQHGLVGHMMLLHELGFIADMLYFSPAGAPSRDQLLERGVSLDTFLPVPGLAQVLAQQGIATRALISADLARTAFSRLCFRGVAEVASFITEADMWVRIREMLSAHRRERLLLVGYLDEIDGIGHLHGPGSDAWRAEFRSMAFSLRHEFLSRLTAEERRHTLFVLTADHGQLAQPAAPVALPDHPELQEHLLLPSTGSLRAAYLYACQDEVELARQYFDERLGN